MSIIEFFCAEVDCLDFRDKRVLEVGSQYVNGSVRPVITNFCKPKEYIGVDIAAGRFVDHVVPAEKLVETFGRDSFDAVISTELLEHAREWRLVINNMKQVLKPHGALYVTTRSFGKGYHGFPYDYWRYEVEDARAIFRDFEALTVKSDPGPPGILVKARKPIDWRPVDLSGIALYSMVKQRRTKDIPKAGELPPLVTIVRRIVRTGFDFLLPLGQKLTGSA